jgi:pimeloyl-ACP methyl ester carboxylesterase
MRHTHRDWGDDLTAEQWRHFAVHGSRKDTNGTYRLHYDPQIARVAQPLPFSPGLFFWDAWYRIRCPVLLLRGELSEVFPGSVAKTMLDVKPGTELVEIAGCGHVPALMSAMEAEIVGNFLRAAPSEEDAPREPPVAARAA